MTVFQSAPRMLAAPLLMAALLMPTPAFAMRITWVISGSITEVGSTAAAELGSLGVFVGTPFTATITYESTTPPVNPPTDHRFVGAILEFSFHAGSYSPVAPASDYETVIYELGATVVMSGIQNFGFPTLSNPYFLLLLHDADPSKTGAMPIVPPSFGSTSAFLLSAGNPTEPVITSDSFTISYSVPEPSPASLPALLVAALGLAYRFGSSGFQRHSDCGTSRSR